MRLGTLSENVYSEGIHWKLPIIDKVQIADLRIDKADGDARSASKDLQNVETKIAVNYQINEGSILSLFRSVGVDHAHVEENLLAPAIQESVKSATAKYTAEELITKRELVR
jgi:regulator of protease activity HflC (stomatin/prohibitin superfamily)